MVVGAPPAVILLPRSLYLPLCTIVCTAASFAFPFWPFLHCRFSLNPLRAGLIEDPSENLLCKWHLYLIMLFASLSAGFSQSLTPVKPGPIWTLWCPICKQYFTQWRFRCANLCNRYCSVTQSPSWITTDNQYQWMISNVKCQISYADADAVTPSSNTRSYTCRSVPSFLRR